jgi:hypothetical protein
MQVSPVRVWVLALAIMAKLTSGCSSAVERLLAKEKVVSSNLIARSCFYRQAPESLLVLFMATWPSGKAEVCKTFITGSNPVVAFITSIEKALRSGLFLRLVPALIDRESPFLH